MPTNENHPAKSTPHAGLGGVLPVFQTPFEVDESIDFESLQREIDWLLQQGVDGIVMAMVSEVLRLSSDERRELAAAACRMANGRTAVIISVGAESSRVAEELARHAQDCGASAVMAIPPVSAAADAEELLRYFSRIFTAVRIPVVVQDASGYVGRPLSVSLYARLLAEFGERIYFKPEATPIGPRLTALREATDGQARVFEGTGGLALVDSFRRGIVGTMPGADLTPGFVALWRALERNDTRRVNALSLPICALASMQNSLDAFVAVEKYLLVKQGVFKNAMMRGPVGFMLDEETRVQVDSLFEQLQQALGTA